MMMEEYQYQSYIIQLNEEKILIFDDIMHRKQMYLDSWFVYFWQGVLEQVKTLH
jgi:hypothetical protein